MTDERASFEATKARLEEILTQVKKKDTSLEQSLDLLEEGVRLANTCNELIDQTSWRPPADESAEEEAGAEPADEGEGGAEPADEGEGGAEPADDGGVEAAAESEVAGEDAGDEADAAPDDDGDDADDGDPFHDEDDEDDEDRAPLWASGRPAADDEADDGPEDEDEGEADDEALPDDERA